MLGICRFMPFTFCHLLTSANTFFFFSSSLDVRYNTVIPRAVQGMKCNPTHLNSSASFLPFFFFRNRFSPAQYFHLSPINKICEGKTTSALKSCIWEHQVANLPSAQCKSYIFQVRETHSLCLDIELS